MPQLHVLVLSAERSQVQVLVGAAQQVDDGEIGGVGVQDGVAVAEEDAHAALLAGTGGPGLAHVDQLLLGPEVPHDRRDVLVVRHVEVVVEVAAQGRVPRERPAHPLPERLDFADRRAGHRGANVVLRACRCARLPTLSAW
jgi:hypothetical protein